MPNNVTKVSETEIGIPKVDVVSKDRLRADLNDVNNRLAQLNDSVIEAQAEKSRIESLLDEADALEVKFSEEV